jgi:AcrR family transcriptional regulator
VAHPADVDTVLDAATEIVLNDGFESANMRAIAAKARITEEELLRLFSSAGQLFVALLNREYAGIFGVIVDHMERDPLGGLLSHIYRHTIGAVHERPLARALYLTDPVALNTIMRAADGFDYMPALGPRAEFIDMMKDAGMVRHDIDSASLSALLSSVVAGASLTAPHQELDRIINGLTVMLERSVDTDARDTSRGKHAFMRYASGLGVDGRGSADGDEYGEDEDEDEEQREA